MDFVQLCVTLGVLIIAPLTWRHLSPAYAAWATVMPVGSHCSYLGMGHFATVIFPLFVISALLLGDEGAGTRE